MEISILLAQQIAAMFLTMAVGYAIVKIGLFQAKDSKVISNMIVYICSPCIIVESFQIELTPDKLKGLVLALIMASAVHGMTVGGTKLLEKPLHINGIEKASIIYSNSGYLVIPLVAAVMGKEWVFYTTAYTIVQTVLIWTHGVGAISQRKEKDYKKILLNPNIVAVMIGMMMFVTELKFPVVIGSCVSGFSDMISAASMLVIGMVIGDVDLLWVSYLLPASGCVSGDRGGGFCHCRAHGNTSGGGIYTSDRTVSDGGSGGNYDHPTGADLR